MPVFAFVLAAPVAAFALGGFVDLRPPPGFLEPRPPPGFIASRPAHHVRVNPLWRKPAPAHMPRFRHRGHTFVFIGAPVYVAPWLSYAYVADAQWGARYSFPGEQESFLFYCPDTAGFVTEGSCPSGWWPVIPDDVPEQDY